MFGFITRYFCHLSVSWPVKSLFTEMTTITCDKRTHSLNMKMQLIEKTSNQSNQSAFCLSDFAIFICQIFNCSDKFAVMTGADPGFGQGGGPAIFLQIFCPDLLRARLRALEALGFSVLKYAFSHFSWYLFFKVFNL